MNLCVRHIPTANESHTDTSQRDQPSSGYRRGRGEPNIIAEACGAHLAPRMPVHRGCRTSAVRTENNFLPPTKEHPLPHPSLAQISGKRTFPITNRASVNHCSLFMLFKNIFNSQISKGNTQNNNKGLSNMSTQR